MFDNGGWQDAVSGAMHSGGGVRFLHRPYAVVVNAVMYMAYVVGSVRTPTQCHIDLACNTSYHFAASRTVSPRCRLTFVRDRLRLLAHVYDGVASIHMIKSPG